MVIKEYFVECTIISLLYTYITKLVNVYSVYLYCTVCTVGVGAMTGELETHVEQVKKSPKYLSYATLVARAKLEPC